MKFPKITSAPLTQLPTDSSELTPQENYIFEKIFQPEVQMFMTEQSKRMAQKDLEEPKDKHTDKHTDNHKHHERKSVGKKLLIAFLFTLIIVVFSLSPLPSTISSSFSTSRNLFYVIVLAIMVASFMFIPKFIK